MDYNDLHGCRRFWSKRDQRRIVSMMRPELLRRRFARTNEAAVRWAAGASSGFFDEYSVASASPART